jgi:hypothetical protein
LLILLFFISKDPALPWIYFTASVTSIIFILTITAFWYFKRVSFEAQLKAMNWIIEPDDLFSMEEFGLKYKQLKRDRHKVRRKLSNEKFFIHSIFILANFNVSNRVIRR